MVCTRVSTVYLPSTTLTCMTTPATPAPQRRRPLGVVLIAAFLVADAALVVAQRVFDVQTGARQALMVGDDDRVVLLVYVLVSLRLVAALISPQSECKRLDQTFPSDPAIKHGESQPLSSFPAMTELFVSR